MPPEPLEADAFDPALRPLAALIHRHTLDFQAIDGVFDDRSMRQKCKFLEHHRRLVAAKFAQIVFAHLADIDAVIENFAGRRIDQAVDMADQRGFARAGQTHDHHDTTGGHGDVDVLQAEHMAMLFIEFGLAEPGLDLVDEIATAWSEDLVEVLDLDCVTSHGSPPNASAAACHRPGWCGQK
jgi:hypothetical protein